MKSKESFPKRFKSLPLAIAYSAAIANKENKTIYVFTISKTNFLISYNMKEIEGKLTHEVNPYEPSEMENKEKGLTT